MATRYDYFAGEVLKEAGMKDEIPNVVKMAKKFGIELLATDSYIVQSRGPSFTFYSPNTLRTEPINVQDQFDKNMPFHLLLATPSASEQREWIAYCSVLAYLYSKKMIAEDFFFYAQCGGNELRNDTFHRFAVSVLIPEKKLAFWSPQGRKLDRKSFSDWSRRDIEEAAVFFGVPIKVMEERLNLYEGGGILLRPSIIKKHT